MREDAAGLVSKHLPKYNQNDFVTGLKRGLEMANRFGITSLQEASADSDLLEAYLEKEVYRDSTF